MYSLLNKLSVFFYFYMSKNIILYVFLLVFKIVESLQYIVNKTSNPHILKATVNFLLETKRFEQRQF